MIANFGARVLLAVVWLLHFLPLHALAALGRGLGLLIHAFAFSRRRVALRNVELCLPELSMVQRRALVREHFQLAARCMLELSLLWHASPQRLRRLIRVEGDVHLAEREAASGGRPVMWLVPHFVAVDVAGAAAQLFQEHHAFDVYATQSNPVLDRALLRGRARFGGADFYTRHDGARVIVRAIKKGHAFFNPCDMDFGLRDAAFVPFFGHPAATLLAPSRMARAYGMVVQPVVASVLPGGQGYVVHFMPPWTDWPSDDPVSDAARMNRFIEAQVRANPAQYLWVHRRFKTRPPGEAPVY